MTDETSSKPQSASTAQTSQTISLSIQPFAGKSFHVTLVTGTEAISTLYNCVVQFTSPSVLDGTKAAGQPASVTITTGGNTLLVAGVIMQFECRDPMPSGDYTYLAVIGPRFGLLDFSQQNQVYGVDTPVAVSDIIAGKLNNTFSSHSTTGGPAQSNIASISFENRSNGSYPVRNNVVQFNESDLNFICRTCEHYGLFYFFEHKSDGEKLIFGDANVNFNDAALLVSAVSSAAGHAGSMGLALPFRLTRGQADDVSISSFRAVNRPVPNKIYMRDYNDTQAGTQLLAQTIVDSNGFGAIVEYGQNFTSVDEGNQLVQVRAAERNSQKTVFVGASTAPQIRPGYFFTLSSHPNAAMNGKYVVTSVSHQAGDGSNGIGAYQNTFECISFNTPFRPKRVTPRPVAAGLFNALVDSSGSGSRADIDSVGRYRLRHFYDESTSQPGHYSTFVRKSEPYTGKSDTGFHFPLLKDTEVLVSYVNGDPDRPLIVGAVPNSLTPSVSNQGNATVNRFRTPSGGLFELNDGPVAGGSGTNPYLRLVAQNAQTTDFPDSSYIRLGAYVADENALLASAQTPPVKVTSSTVSSGSVSATQYEDDSLQKNIEKYGEETSSQQQGNTQNQNTQEVTVTPTTRTPLDGGILMYSKQDLQITTVGAAYMDFQAGHATMLANGDGTYSVPNGQYTLSANNGVSITAGTVGGQAANLSLVASNYISQKAFGPLDEITYGDSYKNVHGNATELFLGTKNTWVTDAEVSGKLAASMSMFFGIASSMKFSLEVNLTVSAIANLALSAVANLTIGFKAELILGGDFKLVGGIGSMKIVTLQDTSFLTSGFKFVATNDLKFVTGADGKIVEIDYKIIDNELKWVGKTVDLKAVKVGEEALAARAGQIATKIMSLSSSTFGLKLVT